MASLRPNDLILRCYGHKIKNNRWFGVCLELNLAAEAESPEQLREKLFNMIKSYIDTVLDTDDKDSISQLLIRRAPLYNWAIYYLIKLLRFPKNFLRFNEAIPFTLAQNNC